MNLKQHKEIINDNRKPIEDGLLGELWRNISQKDYAKLKEFLKKEAHFWESLSKYFTAKVEYEKDKNNLVCQCIVKSGSVAATCCRVFLAPVAGEIQILDVLKDKEPVAVATKLYKQNPKDKSDCQKLLRALLAYKKNKNAIFKKFEDIFEPYKETFEAVAEELNDVEDSRRQTIRSLAKKISDSDRPCLETFAEDYFPNDKSTLLSELDSYFDTDTKEDFIDDYNRLVNDGEDEDIEGLTSLGELIEFGLAVDEDAIIKVLNQWLSSDQIKGFIEHCKSAYDLEY